MAGNVISDNALDKINRTRQSKGLGRLNQAQVMELSKGGVDTKTLESAPAPKVSAGGAKAKGGGVSTSGVRGTHQTSTGGPTPMGQQPSSKPTTQSG